MTLSSVPSPQSSSLSTQEPAMPAPGPLRLASSGPLQAPDGMPAPRRAAAAGPSASLALRGAQRLPASHESRFPPAPAAAAAGQEQSVHLSKDFSRLLALAGDHYAALGEEVERLGHMAGAARAGWLEHGGREDLAAAQTLDIQGALLNGLYSFRIHHMDWLSQTPMVSPVTLANLLPLFRHALALCEEKSEAVQFPVPSPHLELTHLQARVRESLQGLLDGQWQGTLEGMLHAQRHEALRSRGPDTPPAPFAGLQDACRELDQVLTQLQRTLKHGPAAGTTSAEVPAGDSVPLPPTATTALHAALEPLRAEARRLGGRAEAMGSRRAAGGRPWELHAREFKAWEAVVNAWDACTGRLKAEAAACGLGSGHPAVRSLQRAIDKASSRALERAARAADDTLAAFAKTCQPALFRGFRGDLAGARVGSYAELGAQCRELADAWQESDLRPRLRKLEGRMAQYLAYEIACRVREDDSNSHARVRLRAEQLHEAATLSRRAIAGAGAPAALAAPLQAFHKACSLKRSTLLLALVDTESRSLCALFHDKDPLATPARERCAELAAACGTLFIGDLLPQAQVRAPGTGETPPQAQSPALPEADAALVAGAAGVVLIVSAQRNQAIELPAHDAPLQARLEQQGGWAVLGQMELTAGTAMVVLRRFHHLAETLGATPPEWQPALVWEHADALEQRAKALQVALRDHCARSDEVRNTSLHQVMASSQSQLRADLRLVQRLQVSLQVLARLLEERAPARQCLGELEQGRQPDPAGDSVFNDQAYRAIAAMLREGLQPVEQDLLREELEDTAGLRNKEKAQHDTLAAAMQCRIDAEQALVQGRLLLALAARADTPDAGHRAKAAELFDLLTAAHKTLRPLAAGTGQADKYREQQAINNEVGRALLALKLGLSHTPPAGSGRSAEP